MLFSLAKPYMDLHLNSKVVSVGPHGPSVTLQSGLSISADLVIGCDGIKSVVRGHVLGHKNIPLAVPTGDVAYRAILPTEGMMGDTELQSFIENPEITCWMGPGKHLIGYRVVSGFLEWY